MNYLVTGATGLVGLHLVEYLINQGNTVVALGRDKEKLLRLEQMGADTKEFDLTWDREEYLMLISGGAETIWYHCAAAVTGASDSVLEEVNVKGTKKLVSRAEELDLRMFVLVSSYATYGLGHEQPMTEDTPQTPGTLYGQSKLAQEEIIKASKLSNWIIVRPPTISGPYDQNFMMEVSQRIKKGKMPSFSKEGKLGIVDARDLARALYKLSHHAGITKESYNIQGDSMPFNDFVDLLGRKLGETPPYGPNYPYFVAMAIGTLADLWAKIRGKSSARGISRYRIRALTEDRILDTSKIENEVEFSPQHDINSIINGWLQIK